MTTQDLIDTVDRLEDAIRQMLAWISPGGSCCGAPRQHGYCTNPGCATRHEVYAAHWARIAAHEARTLIALERVVA